MLAALVSPTVRCVARRAVVVILYPLMGLWLLPVIGDRALAADGDDQPAEKAPAISFYRQVRPILQRECVGCHQPAKSGGKLLLTSFASLQKGGESGAAIEAGKPDESLIVDYISGDEPMMPLNSDPLSPEQIELIRAWILQGAADDTPASVVEIVSAENPPKYERPPVITSLAYSPAGDMLAITGFHEILIHNSDGSEVQARLVGRAQRIESMAFSPDGKLIGAVGGTPALFGEVQIWDVAEKQLLQSVTMSHDTLFGASFNKDGTLFAFGGADNRARVIRVDDGEVIMRMDAHSDWVLGTAYSLDQDHLITVSRDQAMKLSVIETGQFIDNITSITPGALKGGLMAVRRHPQSDQVLTGGADGEPKLYKIFRTRKRIIGDDFNHIRSYSGMPGRIFDLAFNSDGSRFVAGSSTATSGAARIYKTGEYNNDEVNNEPDLGATREATAQRSSEKMLVHELAGIGGPIYAVAYRPDGKQVAVAGFEGIVRLYDAETGELVREFVPVELTPAQTAADSGS